MQKEHEKDTRIAEIQKKHIETERQSLMRIMDTLDVFDKTVLMGNDVQEIEEIGDETEIVSELDLEQVKSLLKTIEETNLHMTDNTVKQLYRETQLFLEEVHKNKKSTNCLQYLKEVADHMYEVWSRRDDSENCTGILKVWRTFEGVIGRGWVFKIAFHNKISIILMKTSMQFEGYERVSEEEGGEHVSEKEAYFFVQDCIRVWNLLGYTDIIRAMWTLYNKIRTRSVTSLMEIKRHAFLGGDIEIFHHLQKMAGPVFEYMFQQIETLNEESITFALKSGYQVYVLYRKQCLEWTSTLAIEQVTGLKREQPKITIDYWAEFSEEEIMRRCFHYIFHDMMRSNVNTSMQQYHDTMIRATTDDSFLNYPLALEDKDALYLDLTDEDALYLNLDIEATQQKAIREIKQFIDLTQKTFLSAFDLHRMFDVNTHKQQLLQNKVSATSNKYVFDNISSHLSNIYATVLRAKNETSSEEYWNKALTLSGFDVSKQDVTVGNCIQILRPIFSAYNLSKRILQLPRTLVLNALGEDLFHAMRKKFRVQTEEEWRDKLRAINDIGDVENFDARQQIYRIIPREIELVDVSIKMQEIVSETQHHIDALLTFQEQCTELWDIIRPINSRRFVEFEKNDINLIKGKLRLAKLYAEQCEDLLYFYIQNFAERQTEDEKEETGEEIDRAPTTQEDREEDEAPATQEDGAPATQEDGEEDGEEEAEETAEQQSHELSYTAPPQNSVIMLCLFQYTQETHINKFDTHIQKVRKGLQEFEEVLGLIRDKWSVVKSRHIGLGWEYVGLEAPTGGEELVNTKLSNALKRRTDFTQREFDKFQIQVNLSESTYVKSGGNYFKPVGKSAELSLRVMQECLEDNERNKQILHQRIVEGNTKFKLAYKTESDDVRGIEINNSVFIHYTMVHLIVPYLRREARIHPETRGFYEQCMKMLVSRAEELAKQKKFTDEFLGLLYNKEYEKFGQKEKFQELHLTISKDIEQKFGIFVTNLMKIESFEFFRVKGYVYNSRS